MSKVNYRKAFYVVTSLFFMWGLITVLVDSLIPRLKEIFELTYFQAVIVQTAFFGAFLLLSIPAGNLLHKIGYKKGIIVGLAIMGLGCLLFFPAASFRLYTLFMMGYFILATGIVILQVAANPYVTALGDERHASSRLNLAQAFNSLGTAIAPILGAIFILSDDIKSSEEINQLTDQAKEAYYLTEASAVKTPFVILAISLIVLSLIVWRSKLPMILNTAVKSRYREALKHPRLSLGAIGIFLYVGAEVGISSLMVNYFLDMNLAEEIRQNEWMKNIAGLVHSGNIDAIDDKGVVGTFNTFYWSGAMLGRFIGAWLTSKFKPNRILLFFSLGAITFVLLSVFTGGLLSMWAIIAVGLFNSIMFPTIFSLAIEGLGELKPQGSGVLCTAIVGGGVIPPLTAYFADISGFKWAFILVVLCYAYIWFYARKVKSLS